MRLDLIKVNECFYPSLEQDREIITTIKHGEIYSYELTKKRNAKFHRKYFALLGLVVDNGGYNIDQLLHIIKLKLGHYEMIVSTTGKAIYMPKSINFASMKEPEFNMFYSATIDVILRDFFKNTPKHILDAQVSMVLGFT